MNKTQLMESLKIRGFSKQILNAFDKVPREDFIPSIIRFRAYEDCALPIGKSQTISQPYTIAMMLSMLKLKKGQKVLEIGSGSGYVLALISEVIGKEKGKVFGIERIEELAKRSKRNLKDYDDIEIYHRNGSKGLKERAPYNRILISAACEEIPKPLFSQLKNNGIMVAPIGPRYNQFLVAVQKSGKEYLIKEKIPGFIFVPFVEDN